MTILIAATYTRGISTNPTPLHAVLGASGTIGSAIVSDLQDQNIPVRPVSRSLTGTDLTDPQQTHKAIDGASHVYLCAGLPYSTKIWRTQWPLIMKNVIDASEKADARLIFLDNMYLYGPSPLMNPLTEEHPQKPESEKGKIRKEVADSLLAAISAQRVQGLIGRCADFYGPDAPNSLITSQILERMTAGKAPQWIGDPSTRHSLAYTVDTARALVRLALDEDTYGDVWHLPVAEPALSVQEIAERLGELVKAKKTRVQPLPKPMLKLLSLAVPIVKEAAEMAYQYEHDYVFSCAKFLGRYPEFRVTTYAEGLTSTVEATKQSA